MGSKAQRRRNKLQLKQVVTEAGKVKSPKALRQDSTRHDAKPTPERRARGLWAEADRMDKRTAPLIDLCSDMIGDLYQSGQITASQEQAARSWQEIRSAFIFEIGASTYKSCLAGGSGGYDNGDGNPEVMSAYNSLRDKIGRVKASVLAHECEKLYGERPNNIYALRAALDCVARG